MAKNSERSAPLRLLRNLAEAAVLHLVFLLMRCLPVEAASNLGGWAGRKIGPRLGLTRRARRNLRLAFPQWSDAEIEATVVGMWDNLGRVVMEYPHLGHICDPASGRIEVRGFENVEVFREPGTPGILVSAHLANWEVAPVAAGYHGIDITIVVRSPNNPLTRDLLERARGISGGQRIAKGAEGAKQALQTLRQGRLLAMLADQKLNEGIPVAFFGHDAMTPPAPAQLALRFKCRLIPIRVERLGAARFRVTCCPPMELPDSGDRHADVATLTRRINVLLEEWIRARPTDWLWLHRRWPKELYRKMAAE